jgi:hypothetical protein
MQAARVEQKPVVPAGHRHAEVVAHALAQPLMGCGTQGQSQICAQRQKGFKSFMGLHGSLLDTKGLMATYRDSGLFSIFLLENTATRKVPSTIHQSR